MFGGKQRNFRIKNPFETCSKKFAAGLATFIGFFLLGLSLVTIFVVSADSERLEEDSELTYYLNVKYDGVDKSGIKSSDSVASDVRSGIITVKDTVPDGLIFQSFVTTSDGTIGSVERNNTNKACGGFVIDDTHETSTTEGKWNSNRTEYTYHGLHYDANTKTVSFRVENLKAGCKLEVGIKTKTPTLTTNPSRMDFYNTAFGQEGGLSVFSNTTHNYIMRGTVSGGYKVSYRYDGTIPINAPTAPAEANYLQGNKVTVAINPVVDGYIFSGWKTTNATIQNGAFTMPGGNVELVGTWKKDDTAKYNVSYNISGDAPEYYVTPSTKTYTAGNTVLIDDTEKDTQIDDYVFQGWNITSPQNLIATNNEFTMPSNNVVITGTFEQITYSVCYNYEGAVIPPSVTPPACVRYPAGAEVTTPDVSDVSGYKFTGWYSPKTFTMPSNDVTIDGEWMRQTGTFAPEISKTITDRQSAYYYGETVKFKITVKNTAGYAIKNVILEEKLDGAKFVSGSNYTVETNQYVVIPTIAANSSIDVYAEYQVKEDARKTYTNTVELVGAVADNDNNLDSTKRYIAEASFTSEPEPVTATGVIIKSLPYVGLIILAIGLITLFRSRKFTNFIATISEIVSDFMGRQDWKRIKKSYAPAVIASLAVVFAGSIVWRIASAATYTEAVKSIELTSQHTSFANTEPGSWHIEKSAEWFTGGRKARITFNVETIVKNPENKNYDVVMVLDNSGSMWGVKMERVIEDATELANSLLSNSNNKIGLVNFNTTATKLSNLTNNRSEIVNQIQALSEGGMTNYYDGFLRAKEILQGYQKQDDRELILLFLTDGYPNTNTPNQIAEYKILKQLYPYMTVAGIQYEMGEEILDPIVQISDVQYVANMTNLENTLFQASTPSYVYDKFVIEDFIESNYWTLNDIKNIKASFGNVTLTQEQGRPKVTWDLSGLRSGLNETLTIDVALRSDLVSIPDNYLNTNHHETVATKLLDTPDENITSEATPVLKTSATVTYDPNTPNGCTVSNMPGTLTEKYAMLNVVRISSNTPECAGYTFKGWEIATDSVKMINEENFIIYNDTIIRATWGKVSIEKRTEGEVYEETVATLLSGPNVNTRLKALANNDRPVSFNDYTVVSIEKAESLPVGVTQLTHSLISSSDSALPIYAWFEEPSTIYVYTEARKMESGTDLSRFMEGMTKLTSMDAFADLDTSKATNMYQAFSSTSSLESVDSLSTWDTSNVTAMQSIFSGASQLSNIDGLKNWNTSNVTDMSMAFGNTDKITNVDALANWDTSSVTDMSYMFYSNSYYGSGSALSNIDGLKNWDTSKVTNMSHMFQSYSGSALSNIDGAINWNTSSVTDMSYMFYSNSYSGSALSNIDGAINWNTSNVTNMVCMFKNQSSLANIDGAKNWDTSKVTNMTEMFTNANLIPNLDALAKWNTSNVTKMTDMFRNSYSHNQGIQNIDGVANWNTSKVTNMASMFLGSHITNINALARWDISNVVDANNLFSFSNVSDVSALASWNLTNSKLTNISGLFSHTKVTNVDAVRNWDTSKITDMSALFYGTTALTNIDGVKNWNTSNVTDLAYLFNDHSGLTNLNALANWDTSKVDSMEDLLLSTTVTDISALASWRTPSLTNLRYAFSSRGITDISSLASWDTSKVTNMYGAFYGLENLTSIDALANWNTSSVDNMANMFQGVKLITNLNALANWNTSNVTNMSSMFNGYNMSYDNIDGLRNWDTSKVTDMSFMFSSDYLTSLSAISSWNTSKVEDMSYMFYSCRSIYDARVLNSWDVSSLRSKSSMFSDSLSESAYPTWYQQ